MIRLTAADRELCRLTGIAPARLLAHKQRIGSPRTFTPNTRSVSLDEGTVKAALAAIRKGDTKAALRILESVLATLASGPPSPEPDPGPEAFSGLTSADRALCKLLGTDPRRVAAFKSGRGPRAAQTRSGDVAFGRGERVRMRSR